MMSYRSLHTQFEQIAQNRPALFFRSIAFEEILVQHIQRGLSSYVGLIYRVQDKFGVRVKGTSTIRTSLIAPNNQLYFEKSNTSESIFLKSQIAIMVDLEIGAYDSNGNFGNVFSEINALLSDIEYEIKIDDIGIIVRASSSTFNSSILPNQEFNTSIENIGISPTDAHRIEGAVAYNAAQIAIAKFLYKERKLTFDEFFPSLKLYGPYESFIIDTNQTADDTKLVRDCLLIIPNKLEQNPNAVSLCKNSKGIKINSDRQSPFDTIDENAGTGEMTLSIAQPGEQADRTFLRENQILDLGFYVPRSPTGDQIALKVFPSVTLNFSGSSGDWVFDGQLFVSLTAGNVRLDPNTNALIVKINYSLTAIGDVDYDPEKFGRFDIASFSIQQKGNSEIEVAFKVGIESNMIVLQPVLMGNAVANFDVNVAMPPLVGFVAGLIGGVTLGFITQLVFDSVINKYVAETLKQTVKEQLSNYFQEKNWQIFSLNQWLNITERNYNGLAGVITTINSMIISAKIDG